MAKTILKSPQNVLISEDERWMKEALRLARRAEALGEVPVGAVLVQNGVVVAKGFNRRETWKTPIGHAEIITLQRASQKQDRWRLEGTTLYVTLEPCLMCAGALVQSRIDRVVFGAQDPKGGALESLYQVGRDPRLNHRFEITGGVLRTECSELLSHFFKKRRIENKVR